MRTAECSKCFETKPLNDTVKVDGNVFCSRCMDTTFPQPDMLDGKSVIKDFDPTACSFCDKDFGDEEIKKISVYPICAECEKKLKNKAFPVWVKAFFAAVLLLVCFSFAWNWKYYQAYNDIQDSFQFANIGDYNSAHKQMNSAANKVPEVEDLNLLAAYYGGIDLLSKDKNIEALKEFKKCSGNLPDDYGIEKLILQAEIGATFNARNYTGFLEATRKNYENDSISAVSNTAVASAYACIYADKKDESARLNALKYLDKAKAIDSTSAEMKEYYNRVEYRIATRNIIDSKEFTKQFPNGWAKN
ncbi:hypothetical protein GR160_11205 [Flavobacterium sp. Sd200]|uniref:hypothetical protein n=1 Tax=Flavobacterium sp. Sd200 TaxID=2692211 RepID=UPI00136FB376|nr:hypothetical protein [Flavobacterium sp. Sd200]MXN91793.1 hypothetical protein [Flavobacterium sp. Sd200]